MGHCYGNDVRRRAAEARFSVAPSPAINWPATAARKAARVLPARKKIMIEPAALRSRAALSAWLSIHA